MARIKRGTVSRAKHNRILKQAKGYSGRRKNTIRVAKQAVDRSLQYAYRDRRNRKRDFRALWIQRINAAARQNGTTYSRLMSDLATSSIVLNRKALAELSIHNPEGFAALVSTAQAGRR